MQSSKQHIYGIILAQMVEARNSLEETLILKFPR